MTIQLTTIVIKNEEKEQEMIMCIVENDSTLHMNYAFMEMTEIFKEPESFKLKKIKSN